MSELSSRGRHATGRSSSSAYLLEAKHVCVVCVLDTKCVACISAVCVEPLYDVDGDHLVEARARVTVRSARGVKVPTCIA